MSVNVIAPSAGESVTEIEVSSWKVADGDWVKADQIIAIAESEKATLEIRSPVSGKVKILSPEGSVISPGTPVGSVDETAPAPPTSPASSVTAPPPPSSPIPSPPSQEKSKKSPAPPSTPAPPPATVSDKATLPIYASPSVRRMIVENNVDISLLRKGQEQGSPLTEADIAQYLQEQKDQNVSGTPGKIAQEQKTVTRKMSRLRQTISKRLVTAQHTAALLTTFNEIDMGEVVAIRSQYKELFKKKHDVGLGFMSFFIKATCEALAEFPIINSVIEEDNIVEYTNADVGIAVATPKGLVVPVIRNAQSLSFKEIEAAIADYAQKGKEGSIPMEDLTGGTFTITNGGTFGSMLSTPIVNLPQSAILGLHNIVDRPVARNGEVVIRPVMYVALTYDHRLIDGADSVRFLYRIKEFIENPYRLLVGI